MAKKELVLSIVLPCLDEKETIQQVIAKAQKSILTSGMSGEVIVADNGSTDGSQELAKALGAKVINVPAKGYGAAIQGGISSAEGKYVVMGDADDSYALDELSLFLAKLEDGFDLVMGNRFAGGIDPGAMPWLHKYFGNPILSWIGRIFFKVPINDFHCGLRAFNKESIRKLELQTTGMEFASEMVVKSAINGLRIAEVPTTLRKDGRTRPPHLRTWRDGWRHLIFLLAASPRWLFLYPGLVLLFLGTGLVGITLDSPAKVLGLNLDLNTYLVGIGLVSSGFQTILMAILARIFATKYGFLPKNETLSRFEKFFSLEKGIFLGIMLILVSLGLLLYLISNWNGEIFDGVSVPTTLRISGILLLFLTSGIQVLFASFFASLMQV